jgi:hypothetical protein
VVGEAEEMLQAKLPEVSTNAAARRAKPVEQAIAELEEASLTGFLQLEFSGALLAIATLQIVVPALCCMASIDIRSR